MLQLVMATATMKQTQYYVTTMEETAAKILSLLGMGFAMTSQTINYVILMGVIVVDQMSHVSWNLQELQILQNIIKACTAMKV